MSKRTLSSGSLANYHHNRPRERLGDYSISLPDADDSLSDRARLAAQAFRSVSGFLPSSTVTELLSIILMKMLHGLPIKVEKHD
jgi:hypothetical protein